MRRLIFVVSSIILVVSAVSGQDAADPLAGLPATCTTDLDFAQVRGVDARQSGDTWRFSVTVEHNDEGWEHYADVWVVVNPESGEIYGERVLAHPHETEQPFTRSLSGVSIPGGVSEVLVVSKCNVHGYGGCGVIVSLR